ncbi:hypothetical protein Tco_1234090, partial [Tanacetum coccineum]
MNTSVLLLHLNEREEIRSLETRSKDCKMVVKEIVSRLLEEEEKLEWWFEQDIDKEEERFEGDEDGGELEDVGRRVKIQKK